MIAFPLHPTNWPFDEQNGRAEKCLDKYSRSPSLKTFGSIIGTLSFLTVRPSKRSGMGNRRGYLIYVSTSEAGLMPCSKRVSIWCVCRTLLAKVRGKLAEEGLDDISSDWMPKWKLSPEFSKTLPSTDLSPFATFISRSRVTNWTRVHQFSNQLLSDFCSKHFEDRSLWNGIRVFLKYLRVNSFREAEACKQLFSRINRKLYSTRLKFLMKIYTYIFLFHVFNFD